MSQCESIVCNICLHTFAKLDKIDIGLLDGFVIMPVSYTFLLGIL